MTSAKTDEMLCKDWYLGEYVFIHQFPVRVAWAIRGKTVFHEVGSSVPSRGTQTAPAGPKVPHGCIRRRSCLYAARSSCFVPHVTSTIFGGAGSYRWLCLLCRMVIIFPPCLKQLVLQVLEQSKAATAVVVAAAAVLLLLNIN